MRLRCGCEFHTSCWFIKQQIEDDVFFTCPHCDQSFLSEEEFAYIEKKTPKSTIKTADQVWATDETFRTEVRSILKRHLLYKKLYAAQGAARKSVLEGFENRTKMAVETLRVESQRTRKELQALPGRQKIVQMYTELERRLRALKAAYNIKFTLLEAHLRPVPDTPKRGWFGIRYGPERLETPQVVLSRLLRKMLLRSCAS